MGVLERHQHRLVRRQANELRQEGGKGPFHADPRRQLERRIASAAVDRQKLGEERDILPRIGRIRLDQLLELVEPRLGTVLAANTGGVFELADDREKGAVLVQRRPEIAQPQVRLLADALLERPCEARLADPRFAADQNDATFAGLRLFPTAQQQLDLVNPPDHRGVRRAQRREAIRDIARTHNLPNLHRVGEALDLLEAERAALEQCADQTMRRRAR